jgi:uncharacterized membrane protein YbhN (UPF0104 family)
MTSHFAARSARGTRRGKLVFAVGTGAIALLLAILTAHRFAQTGWPLSRGHPGLLAAAAGLFLVAYALKVYAWRRLFAADERPHPLALAAANGGAAVMALALPGRLDDALRIAIVRRSPGCPAGVRSLCLSLAMLGLIDSAALAPLALIAGALPGSTLGLRVGLAVVCAVGVAAGVLVAMLPRLVSSRRLLQFRLGAWLRPRTTSIGDASRAWVLVSSYWLVRVLALLLILGTLGFGFSFPLAVLYLCAGSAAGALPIGLAGAATQAGASAAVLVASGVGASQAVGAAIAVQALGVLCGGAIFIVAALVQTRVRHALAPARVPA